VIGNPRLFSFHCHLRLEIEISEKDSQKQDGNTRENDDGVENSRTSEANEGCNQQVDDSTEFPWDSIVDGRNILCAASDYSAGWRFIEPASERLSNANHHGKIEPRHTARSS